MEKEKEVITNMLQNNHEQVMFCSDEESGLKNIIASHSTALELLWEDVECGIMAWKRKR